MYTLQDYQDDKRTEQYLIIDQHIQKLSGDVKLRLTEVLKYFFLQEKNLMKVLCLVRKIEEV